MSDLLFPPSASFRKKVSFELRYGTTGRRSDAERALSTSQSAVRDRLMFCVSLRVAPSAPLIFKRSEPAKSTRWSLPSLTSATPFGLRNRDSTWNVRIACDREECALHFVDPVARKDDPRATSAIASAALTTVCRRLGPERKTPPPSASRTSMRSEEDCAAPSAPRGRPRTGASRLRNWLL